MNRVHGDFLGIPQRREWKLYILDGHDKLVLDSDSDSNQYSFYFKDINYYIWKEWGHIK